MTMPRSHTVGVVVLLLAVLATAVLIAYGVSGHPLPRWVLLLATVL